MAGSLFYPSKRVVVFLNEAHIYRSRRKGNRKRTKNSKLLYSIAGAASPFIAVIICRV